MDRICYKCKGLTEEQLQKQRGGYFFTMDMHQCIKCKKTFTASSLFTVDNDTEGGE